MDFGTVILDGFLNEQNFSTRKEVIKDWLKFPEIVWLDRFSLPVVLVHCFCNLWFR